MTDLDALLPVKQGAEWTVPALAGIDEWAAYHQIRNRQLFLTWTIADEESDETGQGVANLIRSLRMLDAVSRDPITLFINSPGGEIMGGLALINTMRDIESPVHTFVVGQAASMSAIVAVAGDKRLAFPTARWLLHRGHGYAEGDKEDILISAKELAILDAYGDQVVVNFTSIPEAQLARMQRKDKWLGAEEALKLGMVDEIVTPRKTPEGKLWIPSAKMIRRHMSKIDDEEDGSEERSS